MERERQSGTEPTTLDQQQFSASQPTSSQTQQQPEPEPQPTSASDPPPHINNTNPLKRNSSVLQGPQPLPPSSPINSLKLLPLAVPQFTVPPLPQNLSRHRGSASPDTRISPNPARQIFTYPVSYPQDAPREYRMSDEDGQRPAQRRRLSSQDDRPQLQQTTAQPPSKSEEESESRRDSATGKGAMSYDPVHEHHQQSQQQHHARRPSSAQSQRSHVSSYSNHSSNQEGDGSTSPIAGDHTISRDGKKRKHKCNECGQYFTRLHNLKSHLLTHSQEKPFICQECGHKFRRLHDLKRHHKLHTGERPYTCPGCNRSFARMDALNRHRKPGGECSSHNLSTSSSGQRQTSVERRMSLPPGFGRPPSQGSTSPLPPSSFLSESNINPALATAAHGASYPPTHLPPKPKHHYARRDPGDTSPGLLAPPPGNISFGRSPPPTFGSAGNGRGIQPPPLIIPNSAATGPTLSPIHSHHYSAGGHTGSSSSGGGRSGLESRSPVPPIARDDQGNPPPYPLTESPRGMTPPPVQPAPPLAVPPSTLPLLPSPGALISPSQRAPYDRTSRQSSERQSIDLSRAPEDIRAYINALMDRNGRLEDRVAQLESYVGVLWQDFESRRHSLQPLEPTRGSS